MFNKKIYNFSYFEVFLISSYLICWFSISTSFYDIEILFVNKNKNLVLIINFLRQFLNLVIFPILLIILIKKYNYIKFKNELIFIFSLIYFLSQIPGLFFTGNSITNLIYIISAINILFIFILVNIYFDSKKYHIFFYIIFSMLLLITILNYDTFVNFIYSRNSNTLYTYFFSEETFLGKRGPRSTGSSRTLLIIMIISFIILNNFFKKNYSIKILIYVILSTIILLFQSRTTLVLLLTFILLNYIYEKKFTITKTLKYLIIHVLIPILFLYTILFSKEFFYNKEIIKDLNEKGFKSSVLNVTDNFRRPIDPETYSSGRLDDWKSILSKVDKSILYGFGAQGDRFLINQTASNGMIYAISSSGVLGFINFIFFSLLCLWIILKNFVKITKSILFVNFYSSIIVLLLLLRSILESSYAVFSLDFIVIYTFINYLNKFSFKNDNGN